MTYAKTDPMITDNGFPQGPDRKVLRVGQGRRSRTLPKNGNSGRDK